MSLSFTLVVVLSGASLLGTLAGMLGSFALLRRQSLLGDALAHAALPGVCLAFLVTGTKSPVALLAGALAAGIAGALSVLVIVRGSRVKEDTAMGIVLSVFFGAGIVLLTRIQRLPGGNQSGLDKFLFGQAATLVTSDLVVMAVLGAAVLVALALLYKEFKLLAFDQGFAASLGLPVRALDIVLTGLLVVVVMVGLQMVGVVLMVATLITPAAAARQWTDRLGTMLWLAAGFGAAGGAAGAVASASVERLPTGPTIVLALTAMLVVSLLVAPRRGIAPSVLRQWRLRRRVRRENLLKDLYRWAEEERAWRQFVSAASLAGLRGQSNAEVTRLARRLAADALVEVRVDQLRLTEHGLAEAERIVRKHRLWELYLARRLELPQDHVHRDAEAMEHALSDRAVDELEELLDYPAVDPHGRPIPARRET